MISNCDECQNLLNEYEQAKSKQVELENMLRSAASLHDSNSIRALQPKVYAASRHCSSLRAAVRAHRVLHVDLSSV
jgi:hypothetical protein